MGDHPWRRLCSTLRAVAEDTPRLGLDLPLRCDRCRCYGHRGADHDATVLAVMWTQEVSVSHPSEQVRRLATSVRLEWDGVIPKPTEVDPGEWSFDPDHVEIEAVPQSIQEGEKRARVGRLKAADISTLAIVHLAQVENRFVSTQEVVSAASQEVQDRHIVMLVLRGAVDRGLLVDGPDESLGLGLDPGSRV